MRKLGWLLNIVRRPVEMVLFIFSSGLLGYALYIISPWYHQVTSGPLSQGFNQQHIALNITGVLLILASLPNIIAVFVKSPRREKWLKQGSLYLFLCFLFFAILRILIYGWFPLTWLPNLMISLVCGGLRLYLEVRKD